MGFEICDFRAETARLWGCHVCIDLERTPSSAIKVVFIPSMQQGILQANVCSNSGSLL